MLWRSKSAGLEIGLDCGAKHYMELIGVSDLGKILWRNIGRGLCTVRVSMSPEARLYPIFAYQNHIGHQFSMEFLLFYFCSLRASQKGLLTVLKHSKNPSHQI